MYLRLNQGDGGRGDVMMAEDNCKENAHRYYVTFNYKENYCSIRNYKCYGYSVDIVTNANAESFAWGFIRFFLESKGMPLVGYATNVCVIDSNTMECIGRYEIIPIPSSNETILK